MKKQIEKNKIAISLVAGLAVLLSVGLVGSAVYGSAKESKSIDEQIQGLLEKLRIASQNEMATGQTKETPYGTVFSGQSAEKMKNLNSETQNQIDDLIARPESERQLAISEIKRFAKKQDIPISYNFTAKSSYNSKIASEIYIVDMDQYEIDARNNKIIQFGPRPRGMDEKPKYIDTTSRYSASELEKMARQFILDNAPDVNLGKLTFKKNNKDDINYFFRWEDVSREVEEMHPFVQVGFSRGGTLLSYTNTLGL